MPREALESARRLGRARIAWAIAPDAAERRGRGRALLRGLVGGDAEFYAVCPRCGGPHGPLRVRPGSTPGEDPEPLVSVAYAGPLVVAGAAPRSATAFAIDAELDTASRRRAVREAIGSDRVRDWTQIEAVLKARGTGLRGDFAATRIEAAAPENGAEVDWTSPAADGFPALVGRDARLELPGGSVALLSVAYDG
ncbi:hypothetical protein [Leucobacter sp.]